MKDLLAARGVDDCAVLDLGWAMVGQSTLGILSGHGASSSHNIFTIGDYICLFSGEIFSLDGKQFVSQKSESAFVLNLYLDHGEIALSKLEGMFAVVILNKVSRESLCFVDNSGVKQLYCFSEKKSATVIIASEASTVRNIASLVQGETVPVENKFFTEYARFQFPVTVTTPFVGISEVKRGCVYRFDGSGKVSVSRVWENYRSLEIEHSSYSEYHVLIKTKFTEVIKEYLLHSDPEIKHGCYLSGGADSSIVSTLVTEWGRVLGRKTALFHGRFDVPGFDETEYASRLAKSLKQELNIVEITEEKFVDNLFSTASLLDVPGGGLGAVSLNIMQKAANENDCRVLYSGNGADELWGGYSRYIAAYLIKSMEYNLTQHQDLDRDEFTFDLDSAMRNIDILRGYYPLLKKLMKYEGDLDPYIVALIRNDPRLISDADQHLNESFKTTGGNYLTKMTLLDFDYFLRPLLFIEDRLGLRNDIEVRVPFLDARLVKAAYRCPPQFKMRDGRTKKILRRAFQGLNNGLDASLSRNDKMGFPVPFRFWLERKGLLYDCMHTMLSDSKKHLEPFFGKNLKIENLSDRELWGMICANNFLR